MRNPERLKPECRRDGGAASRGEEYASSVLTVCCRHPTNSGPSVALWELVDPSVVS